MFESPMRARTGLKRRAREGAVSPWIVRGVEDRRHFRITLSSIADTGERRSDAVADVRDRCAP
jgi:hypothetical protein